MCAAPATITAPSDEIVDVWSRTAPKYRRRAALLLLVTFLLFAGLCCFTYWLRTGQYGPWSDPAFFRNLMWQSFNPVGPDQVTLVDFLLFPISVEQAPIQWVIMGLLLASLASFPILVAILYRLPAALPCVAMVAVLAAMPWLGLTILAGCVIAALPRFRLSFRFASALLGLIPVALYFISATREPADSFAMTPYRAKLAAPWVLASLGSCVICGVALSLAKLINYRPGGIAPLLAVLFAVPVILFHSMVGRDELEYRILERRVGPGSEVVFVNRALIDEVEADARAEWAERPGESLNALRDRLFRRQCGEAFEKEAEDRAAVEERCDAFLTRYADSRYAANVLYLKGRALDLRIDRRLISDSGVLQFHMNLPRFASRGVWSTLADRFAESGELSAVALHQLALLDSRMGRLADARRHLDELVRRFDVGPTATQPAPADQPAAIFERPPPWRSLRLDVSTILAQARRLRELIESTANDPQFGDRPLREFLSLDPHDPEYVLNLGQIALRFPGSHVAAHAVLLLVQRESQSRTAAEPMRQLAAAFPQSPAQPAIRIGLAAALEQEGRIEDARREYVDLIRKHAASCYAFEARARLSALSLAFAADEAAGGGR